MKTRKIAVLLVTVVLATAACSSSRQEQPGAGSQVGSSDTDAFFEQSFDASLKQIYEAEATKNSELLRRIWRTTSNESDIPRLASDSNALQLVVLAGEALYVLSPEDRAGISDFMLRMSKSSDPGRREMAALVFDTIEGVIAVDVLKELALDSSGRVSEFALQSIKSKLMATRYFDASNQDGEDAKALSQALPEICESELLIEENKARCFGMVGHL